MMERFERQYAPDGADQGAQGRRERTGSDVPQPVSPDILVGTLVNGARDPVRWIREVQRYGFECFSLIFHGSMDGVDPRALAEEIRPLREELGVRISSISLYANLLGETAKDRENRDSFAALIDNAPSFGTDLVSGFTGRVRGEPIPSSLGPFGELFRELARRAADRGVRIAFENCRMGGDWERGDWNIAHGPVAWELMFNEVPAENVGLEWEPAHQIESLVDPMAQLSEWGTKIFHVHGKDAALSREMIARGGIHGPQSWVEHRFPGLGECDWRRIVSELRRCGYRGAIDIEGWHDPVYRKELELTGQVMALRYLLECRGEIIPKPGRS